MTKIFRTDPLVQAQVLELVTRESAMALSARELKHRLAGYGYGIRATETGPVVETLPHGQEVCALPQPSV